MKVLLPWDLLQSGLLVVAVALAGVLALVPGAWSTLYRKTGVGPGAWLLATGLAVGGIALSALVGDPRPFCEGVGYRGCLTPYGYAAAIFVASTLGAAIAVGHLGRYRRIRNATLVPAREATEGLVAVEGRIVPTGPAADGPVSGAPTVWYRSVVEEPALFGGHIEGDRETEGNRFYVEDGSGRLLVAPAGIDEHDAAEHGRSATAEGGDRHRRRREWSYRPGDAVTVVGRAADAARTEYPAPVAVGHRGPVLVSDRSLDDLGRWAARRAVVGGAFALGVGGPSLLGMLVIA